MKLLVVALMATALGSTAVRAQTPDEWISLGTRIHGGYGVLIPIGIRIGLDAQARLKAEPRGLTVTYHTGEKAPCPCIADGVMIATQASPGQGTLQISPDKAPAGLYAAIVIRNRKTGEGLHYTIGEHWAPKIIEWNRSLDPRGRHAAAMEAQDLFKATPAQ